MAELAPKDVIASLRRPRLIFTDAYLNDPIKFEVDDRFQPETVLKQLDDIAIIDRDGAQFAIVDVGVSGSLYYPVEMNSPLYKRSMLLKNIDTTFRQLV